MPVREPAPAAPAAMAPHEKTRLRAAAWRAATVLYPGVVGRVLARELLSWEEFGYRLGPGDTADLVHHLMTAPAPTAAPAPRVAVAVVPQPA